MSTIIDNTSNSVSMIVIAVRHQNRQEVVFHLTIKWKETPSPEQRLTCKDHQNRYMAENLPKIQAGAEIAHLQTPTRGSTSPPYQTERST